MRFKCFLMIIALPHRKCSLKAQRNLRTNEEFEIAVKNDNKKFLDAKDFEKLAQKGSEQFNCHFLFSG